MRAFAGLLGKFGEVVDGTNAQPRQARLAQLGRSRSVGRSDRGINASWQFRIRWQGSKPWQIRVNEEKDLLLTCCCSVAWERRGSEIPHGRE